MRRLVPLVALALPWYASSGQGFEASRFVRAEASRASAPGASVIHRRAPQCRHSAFKFAGQFLAGTVFGAASAWAYGDLMSDPKTYDDYGIHGDSHGSSRHLQHMIVASALGTTGGVWLSAARSCRAVVPAFLGAGLASLPFLGFASSDASPLAVGAFIVLGIPIQSLVATAAQTLAR